ncbi:PRC-barrel domain-containing protein [Microvirga mediterraneensis]|uniref:PRC-barrel domain-containing protein n=1 Tax=Microvirga mediterraneensis TaxID=2754695 RepID=A0A838BIG1_9HYPH|nr:PRC-barrel domain-containing protein [Microvirga mediterraneensis]MBA1155318.1 PRC-barrel domain-containing protein [Microvirga mediterraneensis]
MASKHLMMALLGTALLSAPALAQNQPAGSSTSPNAASSTTTSGGSMSSGNWMTQEKAGQWRASKIEGLNVYNNNNEKIGDISELLVDQSGKIEAVVIGVGGFLGMGEHDVAVPFDQIKFVNEPRSNATASNTTTGTATNAPATTGSTAGSTTTTTTTTSAGNNMNRSAPDHAMLDMTKDQLKAAPEFKYAR